MNILLAGASVTAQSRTGYAPELKKKLASSGVVLDVLGYGAGHFDDAGYFSLTEIIRHAPDLLIAEWHTTGLSGFNKEKLEHFVAAVHAAGVVIVFLILPRVDKNLKADRECEQQVKLLADQGRVRLLDLRARTNCADCLYDGYHTNEFGATFYSDAISEFLADECLIGDGVKNLPPFTKGAGGVPVELPSEVQFAGRVVKKAIMITASVSDLPVRDICFRYRAGPFSPLIEVGVYGGVHQERSISLFDAWCDIERVAYVSLFPKGFKCEVGAKICIEIKISSNRPDYSVCRKKDFSYEGDVYLDVLKMYAVGMVVNFSIAD